MSKVLASIGNASVDMSDSLAPFRSFRRSLICLGEFALRFCQFFFVSAKEVWIRNFFATRESGKALKTKIDTNGFFARRKGFRLDFAREASIPVTHRIPTNVERLDVPTDGAMQDDFDNSNFREFQSIVEKFKAHLWVGETIVPAVSPKAGIARLFAGSDSAKECFERQVDSSTNFLQDLRIHLRKFRLAFLPGGQHLDCVISGERFSVSLPRILASSKCLVIYPPTQFKSLCQPNSLAFSRKKAVLKGHSHICIIPRLMHSGDQRIPRINVGVLLPPNPLSCEAGNG